MVLKKIYTKKENYLIFPQAQKAGFSENSWNY